MRYEREVFYNDHEESHNRLSREVVASQSMENFKARLGWLD